MLARTCGAEQKGVPKGNGTPKAGRKFARPPGLRGAAATEYSLPLQVPILEWLIASFVPMVFSFVNLDVMRSCELGVHVYGEVAQVTASGGRPM
jgi:hypothetical protein